MAARSVTIRLSNFAKEPLYLVSSNLDHGKWSTNPPDVIPFAPSTATFGSESAGFLTGTQGQVTYAVGSTSGPQVQFSWDNPFAGTNSYDATMPSGGSYGCTSIGTRGDDADVAFVVYSLPASDWMQQSLPAQGNLTLREFCMPGSHDAGMSTYGAHTAAGWHCNTITQSCDIGGQLANGQRYFDIRPVISAGAYCTGHYSQIAEGPVSTWQGATGESIAHIIDQVNAFTAQNAELVILHLSHDYDTDGPNREYPSFNQDQWNALFTQLSGLNYLYVCAQAPADLSLFTLNQFIGTGQAAVVVVVQPEIASTQLGKYANNGFYPISTFPLYNNYSGTDNVDTMVSDQLQKMRTQRDSATPAYFLLSWTLTQSNAAAATCGLDPTDSILDILDLANIANSRLYADLLPACAGRVFPNVIYVDNNQTMAIIALAKAINDLPKTANTVNIESVRFPACYLRMDASGFNAFDGSGGGVVNCQYTPPGAYERFVVEPDASSDHVRIRSVAFPNCYLRLDGEGFNAPNGSGGGVVNCQYTPPGARELFDIETDSVSGQSRIHSVAFPECYVRMDGSGLSAFDGSGGGVVNCQYTPPGPWELFTIKPAQ